MKKKLKLLGIALSLPFLLLLFERASGPVGGQAALTAGQKFKNIKVLNDMPADDMGKVMNIMNASLGVDCDHCHVGFDFEKEGKKEKDTAREMVKMTFDLNRKYFNGRLEISCNTCHNGRPHPLSAPNLNIGGVVETRPEQPKEKPSVDDILKRYERALGTPRGPMASRHIKAIRIEPDGTTEPEEIRQKPGRLLIKTTYTKNYVVAEGFDGQNAWKTGNGEAIVLKPDEEEQIKLNTLLFGNADLRSVYPKIEFGRLEQVNGREAYMLRTTSPNGNPERLFFDKITGLLVRRTTTTNTVLGAFVYQVDYSDYRNFGGVKLPVTTRAAMPGVIYTRKISRININVVIDNAVFRNYKNQKRR